MLQYLLDTDHLTLLEYDHPLVTKNVASQAPGAVGFAVATIEESLRGRLSAIATAKNGPDRVARYDLFLESLALFRRYPIAPFDQLAEDQFQLLQSMRLRFGTRDQKIAAIALANNVTLVTRNKRDFGQIPGLVLADWSV